MLEISVVAIGQIPSRNGHRRGGNKIKTVFPSLIARLASSDTPKSEIKKRVKQMEREIFHFLFHLEAKTNKKKKKALPFFCPQLKWKQTAAEDSAEARAKNKISMEKPLPEKKENRGNKKRSSLRQYFFSSCFIILLRPPSQVAKSAFHINIIFASSLFVCRLSRQTPKLLFLLHLTMSPECTCGGFALKCLLSSRGWCELFSDKKAEHPRDDGVGELLKVNIFLGMKRATLEIEIKQPFSFENGSLSRNGIVASWLRWWIDNDGNKIVLLSFNYFPTQP